jgi:hypothetical protein
VRRAAAWLLTLPVAGLGVLVGHELAYRISGTPLGGVHGYLDHAPQMMLVLATVAVAAAAFPSRAGGVPRLPVASIAFVAFIAQEHLERLAHTGELPWLLTDRSFLVGVVVQIPVALACLALARLGAGPAPRSRRAPPRLPAVELALTLFVPPPFQPAPVPAARGRAPPPRFD